MKFAKPKVLLWDIETSPNIGYTWGKYEQDVIAFKQEWQILSVAWKFSGDRSVKVLTREGNKDDFQLCRKLHKVLSSADVVVAHNGDSFDMKKAKSRFLAHGLAPLRPLASVDTLKVARNLFALNSNKLDDLGKYLKVGRKVKTGGFDLWLKCMAGDRKAWKKMAHYNCQDVELLERIYLSLLPWMQRHPSMALMQGYVGCPKCGSKNVQKRGIRANASGLTQQILCKDCSGWYLAPLSKEDRKKRAA